MRRIIIFSLVVGIFSCERNEIIGEPISGIPSCLSEIIQQKNKPLEIWSYFYKNQIVYLTKADCCDQYDQVYAANCTVLCAPSGGFGGSGDGKCIDFYDKAIQGKLIWKKD